MRLPRGLKNWPRDQCPSAAAAQLSRAGVEQRPDKRLRAVGLERSGSTIEQIATNLIFITALICMTKTVSAKSRTSYRQATQRTYWGGQPVRLLRKDVRVYEHARAISAGGVLKDRHVPNPSLSSLLPSAPPVDGFLQRQRALLYMCRLRSLVNDWHISTIVRGAKAETVYLLLAWRGSNASGNIALYSSARSAK